MSKNTKMGGSKTTKTTGKDSKEVAARKCSRCKCDLPEDCTTKTCDRCRKDAIATRKLAKEKAVQCIATKPDGTDCKNKVSKECGGVFCKIHQVEWKELEETQGEIVRRCNSRTNCDPDNPGVKAILADGYEHMTCESCLARERYIYQQNKANAPTKKVFKKPIAKKYE